MGCLLAKFASRLDAAWTLMALSGAVQRLITLLWLLRPVLDRLEGLKFRGSSRRLLLYAFLRLKLAFIPSEK